MKDLQEEVNRLVRSHPPLAEWKLERRLHRLGKMRDYYESKGPEMSDKLQEVFMKSTNALIYAIAMIKSYRRLTIKLGELAELSTNKEDDNHEETIRQ